MSCIRSFSSSSSSSSSSATIIAKGFPSSSSYASCSSSVAWRASMWRAGIRAVVPYFLLLTGRLGVVRCFAAARRGRGAGKMKPETLSTTEEEEDAFYVVRKGDVIGVFKSFSDCQAQVSSSVCDPSVSVYKGHSLKNETEEYLASRGLKNACYTINASDCKEDLFGTLLPCPFQVQDKWKTKQQNMINLCKEAKQLKDTFPSFEIRHVEREFNSDADAEANFAVTLPSGEVYEEFAGMG